MEKESIVKIERKIEIKVDKLFPSAVARIDNLMPSDYNETLKDICLDTLKLLMMVVLIGLVILLVVWERMIF